MKFIEVTNCQNEKELINFENVERVQVIKCDGETYTEITFINPDKNIYMWVKESYAEIKEALGE